jgi:hypothetical protein
MVIRLLLDKGSGAGSLTRLGSEDLDDVRPSFERFDLKRGCSAALCIIRPRFWLDRRGKGMATESRWCLWVYCRVDETPTNLIEIVH